MVSLVVAVVARAAPESGVAACEEGLCTLSVTRQRACDGQSTPKAPPNIARRRTVRATHLRRAKRVRVRVKRTKTSERLEVHAHVRFVSEDERGASVAREVGEGGGLLCELPRVRRVRRHWDDARTQTAQERGDEV